MSNDHDSELTDARRALDQTLDEVAADAERTLAAGEPLGIWLVPLGDDLEPLDLKIVPADVVPPTQPDRRYMMECLAPEVFAGVRGYVVLAECWAPAGNDVAAVSSTEAVVLQAETRSGDGRVRIYPIIRSHQGRPKLALPQEKPVPPSGKFSCLLQVADAFQGSVDHTSLQCALAAHAEMIDTLGDGDILMFAVQEQLVQVIGPEHHVRLCTKLRLADIKADAIGGNSRAQRAYFELTAGRGAFMHVDGTNGSVAFADPSDPASPFARGQQRPKGH
jgi:hypothetical protein